MIKDLETEAYDLGYTEGLKVIQKLDSTQLSENETICDTCESVDRKISASHHIPVDIAADSELHNVFCAGVIAAIENNDKEEEEEGIDIADLVFHVRLPLVGTGEGDDYTLTEQARDVSAAAKRHEWTNYDLLVEACPEHHDELQQLVYKAIDEAELHEMLTGESYFSVAIADLIH